LMKFITRHNMPLLSCSHLLLNEGNKSATKNAIQTFICGGDQLRKEYVSNLLGTRIVYNVYGPTESTVCVTYHKCSEEPSENIPIGKPIANTNIYIIGRDNELRPVGVPGELCVSGAGVTRGYLNRPELTAEKFVNSETILSLAKPSFPNNQYPITNNYLYHTGDLARWQPDGNIEYLGRIDSQVKIRGYRIELGEIENRLLKHETISDAVVLARGEGSDRYLCAYITPHIDRALPGSAELRDYLAENLPAYMIPAY
ncbi:MAG: AMP-binding protein, partial [bacterium]|nr:AMP-binding protein [bacterium]